MSHLPNTQLLGLEVRATNTEQTFLRGRGVTISVNVQMDTTVSGGENAIKKIKRGDPIAVMDRKGLSGGRSDGKSTAGRGSSRCKGPGVGMNSAEYW